MEIQQTGEHEFFIIDHDNDVYMSVMPCKYCNYRYPEYVFLFKPSHRPLIKTKVVIRQTIGAVQTKIPIVCEDGRRRIVPAAGNFYAAGNVFNQHGESLGPNNHDYYVKKLDFKLDRTKYDIKFTEAEFIKAQKYNAQWNTNKSTRKLK